jgi:Protein of unknown function (DUF2934)
MPLDITMCPGGDCPQKEHCLRFTGVILGKQDFFGTPPYLQNPNACPYFMDDIPTQEAIRQQAYAFWQEENCPVGKDMELWLRAEAHLLQLRRNSG